MGYENLIDIKGGMNAMKELGKFNLSEYREPTTML
jgi:hypothetical protein